MRITPKIETFCLDYLKHFSPAKAYKKINPNSSKATCDVNGCKLLKDKEVREHLNELKTKIHDRSYVKINNIINELSKIAFADIGDFAEFGNKDGENYVTLKNNFDTSVLSEVSVGVNTTRLKIDKLKALGLLLEYFTGANVNTDGKETKTFIINYPVSKSEVAND